ncbi:MAG: DUF4231 domain-containing protein [Lactobacillus sp.]|nr:DUF4231 domain-containing protein [Lactobacillus sp.]
MKSEDYIKERLEDQIQWYDIKSSKQKKYYYFLHGLQIVLSASIPVMIGFASKLKWILMIVSIIGGLITIIEGLTSMTKFHEKWIQYRQICEALKREKYMYKNAAGVYDDSNADLEKTLVQRCESIISSENTNWANLDNAERKNK